MNQDFLTDIEVKGFKFTVSGDFAPAEKETGFPGEIIIQEIIYEGVDITDLMLEAPEMYGRINDTLGQKIL